MEKFFYFYYLIGALNNLLAIFIVACILMIIGLIAWEYETFDNEKRARKAINKVFISGIIAAVLLVFIPSKKTFLLMSGAKVVDTFIENNGEVKEIPAKTINLINTYLDELLEESSK